MGAKDDIPIFNLSDPAHFARLTRHIATLKGPHRVDISKVRDAASSGQRGYYFAGVLPYAAKGFRDANGGDYDDKGRKINAMWAHEFFKNRFLASEAINRQTGEVIGAVPGTTTDLDTAEFSAYLEEVIRFTEDFLNTEVPPPTRYYDAPPPDGPPDDDTDRAIEAAAGTPRRF